MKVSIIIPSINPNCKKIFFTLNSVLKNAGHYEVILVLQKTNTNTENKIKKEFSKNIKLKIIYDKGQGISRARNLAIKSASGDWIILIDDDVYIKKNTINILNENISEDDLFYYGNAIVNKTNDHYVNYYIVNSDLNFWNYNRISSIALVINRKVFEKIGLFDENLGSGSDFGSSEESDLILRALLKNIKIKYLKEYFVYHEKANFTSQKIEYYAKGVGSIYKKYLKNRNIKLYIKFLIDLSIRALFLLSFQKKRYVFFKGFYFGFTKYNNVK